MKKALSLCHQYLSKSARSGATMSSRTMSMTSLTDSICSTCGTAKKSGKLSCCARGGAWFKNCGDVGGTQFDHTWAEGIQACKGLLKPSLQVILRNVGVIVNPLNTTRVRHGTQQGTESPRTNGISNNSNSRNFVGIRKFSVYVCAVLIISNLQLKSHFTSPIHRRYERSR